MDVIASYRETRFDGWRSFELLADRVVVKGKQSLGADFDSVVMLNTLQPVASRSRVRTKGFGQAIAMVLASLLLIQSGLTPPFTYWGNFVIVMGIAGALLTLATARRVEWVRINSKAGMPALTVAHAGKQQAAFEPFVEHVIRQIQLVDANTEDQLSRASIDTSHLSN